MDISTKLVHFYGLSINAILRYQSPVFSAPVSPIRSLKVSDLDDDDAADDLLSDERRLSP